MLPSGGFSVALSILLSLVLILPASFAMRLPPRITVLPHASLQVPCGPSKHYVPVATFRCFTELYVATTRAVFAGADASSSLMTREFEYMDICRLYDLKRGENPNCVEKFCSPSPYDWKSNADYAFDHMYCSYCYRNGSTATFPERHSLSYFQSFILNHMVQCHKYQLPKTRWCVKDNLRGVIGLPLKDPFLSGFFCQCENGIFHAVESGFHCDFATMIVMPIDKWMDFGRIVLYYFLFVFVFFGVCVPYTCKSKFCRAARRCLRRGDDSIDFDEEEGEVPEPDDDDDVDDDYLDDLDGDEVDEALVSGGGGGGGRGSQRGYFRRADDDDENSVLGGGAEDSSDSEVAQDEDEYERQRAEEAKRRAEDRRKRILRRKRCRKCFRMVFCICYIKKLWYASHLHTFCILMLLLGTLVGGVMHTVIAVLERRSPASFSNSYLTTKNLAKELVYFFQLISFLCVWVLWVHVCSKRTGSLRRLTWCNRILLVVLLLLSLLFLLVVPFSYLASMKAHEDATAIWAYAMRIALLCLNLVWTVGLFIYGIQIYFRMRKIRGKLPIYEPAVTRFIFLINVAFLCQFFAFLVIFLLNGFGVRVVGRFLGSSCYIWEFATETLSYLALVYYLFSWPNCVRTYHLCCCYACPKKKGVRDGYSRIQRT